MDMTKLRTLDVTLADGLARALGDGASAAVDAIAAAAVAEERERVQAHLTLGQKCGAMPMALQAITQGDGVTAAHQTQYLECAIHRADRSNRQSECDDAGAVADGAVAPADAGDLGDAVARIMRESRGVSL